MVGAGAPEGVVAPQQSFGQMLSGSVKIEKMYNSKKKYKITFDKKNTSNVFMHEATEGNEDRQLIEIELKDWTDSAFNLSPYVSNYKPNIVMRLASGKCPIHNNSKRTDYFIS